VVSGCLRSRWADIWFAGYNVSATYIIWMLQTRNWPKLGYYIDHKDEREPITFGRTFERLRLSRVYGRNWLGHRDRAPSEIEIIVTDHELSVKEPTPATAGAKSVSAHN